MAKAFDKEAWLEAKEAKLEGAKRALEEGIKKLQSSEDWQQMLKSMAHAACTSRAPQRKRYPATLTKERLADRRRDRDAKTTNDRRKETR
jgi:vacuolar-type H+-ATPase subunit E/Vma4